MSLFAIGDLHLAMDPATADKSMDMFGGPWENHTKRLYDLWLNLVASDDTVFIPGDISWALKLEEAKADLEWIDKLPGKKVILKGNHDLWWSSAKKQSNLYQSIHFLYHDAYEGDDFVLAGSRGWIVPSDPDFKESSDRKIFDRELIRLKMSLDEADKLCKAARDRGEDKKLVIGLHYPPIAADKKETEFTELIKQYKPYKVVYGHLHGNQAFANGFEGLLDDCEYRLVSLDKLAAAPLKLL